MESTNFHFSSALTPQGWKDDVTVAVGADGMVMSVTAGWRAGQHINGIAIPAVPNVHSHAHQRLMLGLAERAGPGVLVLNAGARDTNLRDQDCRANILHVAPSQAMMADIGVPSWWAVSLAIPTQTRFCSARLAALTPR